MKKYLMMNEVPAGIFVAVLSAFERSKDVFSSTKISLPALAGNEGAAELAPSGLPKGD